MARGSYLRRTAERAVAHLPALAPPRRLRRADSVTSIDERPPIAASPAAIPANLPPSVGARDASAPGNLPAIATRDHVVAEQVAAPPISAVPSERPRADFVFDAPRLAPPARRTTSETLPEVHSPAEPPAVAASIDSGTIGQTRAPSRPAAHGAVPAADPVAVALAAAARWTRSDPAPAAPSRPVPRSHVPQPASHNTIVGSAAVASQRATGAPPAPAVTPRSLVLPSRAAVAGTRGVEVKHAGIAGGAPAAPERFAEIHIGSVAVEIVPQPEPVKPLVAPAPGRPGTSAVTRLARGLTSSIGLRQS